MVEPKYFDLNIDKILENWEISHAVRELISNAIDETYLSKSKQDVEIIKMDRYYSIRDYGRGLRYENLVQNENTEKLNNCEVIGKFGIGLKDAIAVLQRHSINLEIYSGSNKITFTSKSKNDFHDIKCLHAIISNLENYSFIGTEIKLFGLSDTDMEKSKDFFIKYNKYNSLYKNKFGEIFEKINKSSPSIIYFNGIKIAEEPNFMFHYNITSITKTMRKSLNRERTNVGRVAYADRIKKLLTTCTDDIVIKKFINNIRIDLKKTDELSYNDVYVHIIRCMNKDKKNVFISKNDISNANLIDSIKCSGCTPIFVSDEIAKKIEKTTDISGEIIMNSKNFTNKMNASKIINEVLYTDLSEQEKSVFDLRDKILESIYPSNSFLQQINVIVSNKIIFIDGNCDGLWGENKIIINKDTLKDKRRFAGILIHEYTHAFTGHKDITREFEISLTENLGVLCMKYLEKIELLTPQLRWGINI